MKQELGQVDTLNDNKGHPQGNLEDLISKRKEVTILIDKKLQKHICINHHKKTSLHLQDVPQNVKSNPFTHCFVLHEFHLKACDLTTKCINLLTSSVLIDHHLVLDISSPIGIFQGI